MFGLDIMAKMKRMIGGLAISLRLLKQSPSLKTKQCNGQQLCMCGESQTAGLDKTGMDEGAWRSSHTLKK